MNFSPVDDNDPVVQLLAREKKTIQRAAELMEQYGLTDRGWTFRISRTKTFVGQCYYGARIIEISEHFLHNEWSEIEDTILHEIAHALVGKGHGHGYVWKAKAREIGANPSRVAEESVTSAAQYNYKIICPNCNRAWKRYRLRKSMHRAKCPRCKVQVKIYKIVRRTR